MWPTAGAIGPFRKGCPIWLNMPVSNPESATRKSAGRESDPRGPSRLVDAAPGQALRVVAVGPDHETTLSQEGLGAGSEISVERRLALGGPLIVRLGRTRLALARTVAREILVAAVDGADETGVRL
jgi:Fe2+ transport system protein FeoA